MKAVFLNIGIWGSILRRDNLRGEIHLVELWRRNLIGLMLALAGMVEW